MDSAKNGIFHKSGATTFQETPPSGISRGHKITAPPPSETPTSPSFHAMKPVEDTQRHMPHLRSDDSIVSDGEQCFGILKARVFSANINPIEDGAGESQIVAKDGDEVFVKMMFAALPEGTPPWLYTDIAQRNKTIESHSSRPVKLERSNARLREPSRETPSNGLMAPLYSEQILEISKRQMDPWKVIVANLRGNDSSKDDDGLNMGLLMMVCKDVSSEEDGDSAVIAMAFIPLAEIYEKENRFTAESSNGPLILYEQPQGRSMSEPPRILGTMDVTLWWSPSTMHNSRLSDNLPKRTEHDTGMNSTEARHSSLPHETQFHDPGYDALWKGSLASLIADPKTCNLLLSLLQHKTYRKPLLKLLRSKSMQYDEMTQRGRPIPRPILTQEMAETYFDVASGIFTINQLQFERSPLDSVIHKINSSDHARLDASQLQINVYLDIVELPPEVGDPEDVLAEPFSGAPRLHRLFRPSDEEGAWSPSFQGGVLLASRAQLDLTSNSSSVIYPVFNRGTTNRQSTSAPVAASPAVNFGCEPKLNPDNKSYFVIWVTAEASEPQSKPYTRTATNATGRSSMLPSPTRRRRRNFPVVLGSNLLEVENPNAIPWNIMITSGQLTIPLYSDMSGNHQQRSRDLPVGSMDFSIKLNNEDANQMMQ